MFIYRQPALNFNEFEYFSIDKPCFLVEDLNLNLIMEKI